VPECVALFRQVLGDVDDLVSRGVSSPEGALAWSPDGARLLVGTHGGDLLLLDGWTGRELARRHFAESSIKAVAWSQDGGVAYAGEQSPDAILHALAGQDLHELWSFRLSDELERSAPPAPGDAYGVFTLPAAYGLVALREGQLLVLGTHAWTDTNERARNLGRVWRLDREGAVQARWPADAPADAVFRYPRVDEEAGVLAFPIARSADGEPPPGFARDGAIVLRLPDLSLVRSVAGEPIKPHFERAFLWEAVDVRQDALLLGFGDGRVQRWPLPDGPARVHEVATPMVAGEVPIVASVSWGLFQLDGGYVASTGRTNIPWGSEVAANRPPSAHPGENTVWAWGPDGQLRWNWRAEPSIQGLSMSPDGRTLVVGGGAREVDDRHDLFGAWLLRLDGDGSGAERVQVSCPTEGPLFFHHAPTNDGRVAVVELPWKDGPEGAVQGAYRVTVLR
jgi:WD40 repeat protein